MGEFGIGIKRSQQTFQEHELIKRGTQAKEQELTLQSYITPQRNGEHKNSKQSQSQTANNSTPQWEKLHDWELEMVVGGKDGCGWPGHEELWPSTRERRSYITEETADHCNKKPSPWRRCP